MAPRPPPTTTHHGASPTAATGRDPNAKTPRTFQCRDVLWADIDGLARDLECSVDYLVNESIKQYLRARSYTGPAAQASTAPVTTFNPPAPPPPPPPPQPRDAQGGLPPLFVIYQGEAHLVTKDRFIIGRGKQSTDLIIRDPNLSRQHAMIEFLNGQYYIVDMGSTNGVDFNGQRIARKALAEGDVVRICDHEIRFSYRARPGG